MGHPQFSAIINGGIRVQTELLNSLAALKYMALAQPETSPAEAEI